MKLASKVCAVVSGVVALWSAAPAAAEVMRATDTIFVSRHEVVVMASPKDVWLALISPATWWRSEHTWSGDSKNLTLMPQAGGCFCETIPEVDGPGGFTLQGSVEHMRVVQAYPESALRMIGSLGPLQSEPVTGVLTIAITKVDKGTRIVWEYNVGGAMRYEVPVISKAVDGVMGAQLAALAKPLGVVAMPAPVRAILPNPTIGPPVEQPAAAASAGGLETAGKGAPKPASSGLPAGPSKTTPVPAASPAQKPASPLPGTVAAPKPAPKVPSVDDAFGDLEDTSPR